MAVDLLSPSAIAQPRQRLPNVQKHPHWQRGEGVRGEGVRVAMHVQRRA